MAEVDERVGRPEFNQQAFISKCLDIGVDSHVWRHPHFNALAGIVIGDPIGTRSMVSAPVVRSIRRGAQ